MAFPKGKRRIGCLGEDDAKEKEKFQCVWTDNEADADCITSVSHKEFSINHWLRLQQKVEAAAASSIPLGSFQQRAIASAMALHSIPNIDPTSVPICQAQAQAQAQDQSVSQLQSGKKAMQKQLQSHHLQNQLLQQQLLQQQQLQKQEQQQQQHQQKLPYQLLQQQQLKKQQFQQQHLQRLLQQQQIGAQDYFGSLVERSSKSSPAPIVIPNTFGSTQVCADTDFLKSFSAVPSSSYPLPNSCISTPRSSSSLISDAADDHVSSLLNNHSEAHPSENITLSGVSVLESELQGASCLRALTAAETPHMMPYSMPASTFSSNWIQQTDQLGISSLPLLQNSTVYSCSPVTEQEQIQSELVLPSTVSPAAPAMASIDESDSSEIVSIMFNQLFPQNHSAYGSFVGKQPIAGCYSAPAPDPFTSLNAVVSGNFADGAGNQHQNLPVAPSKATTRSYTKIYKVGSISRAVDVNRFKDYTELRCELAQMFGLEGQLETKSGWQLVFIDNENDILLVGDDPWEVFVSTVRGIRILSPSEVAYYMSNDERVAVPYNCLDSSVMRRF